MLFDDPALQSLKQKFEENKIKKEGIVKTTDKAFGFLECSDKKTYFIPPKFMRNVLHGDRIIAVIEESINGKDKKEQAVPESLVTSALTKFMARVKVFDHKYKVICDDPNLKTEITADDKRKQKDLKLENGDFVLCKLTKHALKQNVFKADIIEFVAKYNDPKLPWTVSLRALDLPLEAPKVNEDKLIYHDESFVHEDLTQIPFVTIDSAKTKDMDDAIYVEKEDGLFKLYVAIADPTAYIQINDDLDKIAAKRSFSIYLPGRDIPMLPRALSDDLCSLKEGEERSSLVSIIYINENGQILFDKTQFKLAKIKSYRRLNYNDVSNYLEQGVVSENLKLDAIVESNLKLLATFAKVRDKYRSENAASFRNRPDYDFVLSDDGALDHIEVNFRRIANQIVEEAMISANLAAGSVIAKTYDTGIFNIHNGFDLKYKKEIIELLTSQGYDKTDDDSLSTIAGFSAIRRYANSLESSYLDNRIRKLQEYSFISNKPGPHYALGVENYATFTSPIRKYGDMINHRLLKALVLHNDGYKQIPTDTILEQMNLARKVNRIVEREVKDWLYVDYLQSDLKKQTIFKAEVFDLSRGGIRLILQENGAMGFLPASAIADDRKLFEINSITGELLVNNQVKLKLGDIIEVKIASINKEYRSIVLSLVHGIEGLVKAQKA